MRILGDLRLGQALINALTRSGSLTMHTPNPEPGTKDGPRSYIITGRDPFYMEDDELITLVRDYVQGLERPKPPAPGQGKGKGPGGPGDPPSHDLYELLEALRPEDHPPL